MFPVKKVKVYYVNYYQVVNLTEKNLLLGRNYDYITCKKPKNINLQVGQIITGKIVQYCSFKNIKNLHIVGKRQLGFMDNLRYKLLNKHPLLASLLGLKNTVVVNLSCKSLKLIIFMKYFLYLCLHLFALLPLGSLGQNSYNLAMLLNFITCLFILYLHNFSPLIFRPILFFFMRQIFFIPYDYLIEIFFFSRVFLDPNVLFNNSFLLSMGALIAISNKYYNFSILMGLITGRINSLYILLCDKKLALLLLHLFVNFFQDYNFIINIFLNIPVVTIHHHQLAKIVILCILHYDIFYQKKYCYWISIGLLLYATYESCAFLF